MTSKIWYEMTNIKYGEIYLTKYLGLQRTLKKIFQVLTLLVSMSGILGWKYFEDYVWIAFILIATVQLLLLIENQLISSDKEIEDIYNLRIKYTKYFTRLEQLWADNFYDRISEDKAIDEYFSLRRKYWIKIEELDNRLNIKKWPRLLKNTDRDTRIYINTYLRYE